MSLDMLLLDEQSTLIHGSINSSRVDTFRRRLSEGSVYSLSGFDVARANPKFRLSDSPVSIRFNDGTFFEPKTDSDKDIPTELRYSGFAAMNSFWHWQILTENSQISLVK